MKYILKRIIEVAQDIGDEVIYLTEALDSNGDYVVVKMTEEQVEEGGIEDE